MQPCLWLKLQLNSPDIPCLDIIPPNSDSPETQTATGIDAAAQTRQLRCDQRRALLHHAGWSAVRSRASLLPHQSAFQLARYALLLNFLIPWRWF